MRSLKLELCAYMVQANEPEPSSQLQAGTAMQASAPSKICSAGKSLAESSPAPRLLGRDRILAPAGKTRADAIQARLVPLTEARHALAFVEVDQRDVAQAGGGRRRASLVPSRASHTRLGVNAAGGPRSGLFGRTTRTARRNCRTTNDGRLHGAQIDGWAAATRRPTTSGATADTDLEPAGRASTGHGPCLARYGGRSLISFVPLARAREHAKSHQVPPELLHARSFAWGSNLVKLHPCYAKVGWLLWARALR
jgi:hypothetical protein